MARYPFVLVHKHDPEHEDPLGLHTHTALPHTQHLASPPNRTRACRTRSPPSLTATMSTASVNTPPTADLGYGSAKMAQLDRSRRTMLGLGMAQLVWGLVGMCISFSWMSNLLTLISGIVVVSATYTEDRTRTSFSRRYGGSGAGGEVCQCCGIDNTRGLCIAVIVFAVLEVSVGCTWG